MACFIVPGSEAIVVSIIQKVIKTKEAGSPETAKKTVEGKTTLAQKISWLTGMLWGGAILLCLEHIWHGEVVLYPPFLTAMADPTDTAEMLTEMGTVGVGMAVLVTVTWIVMILLADRVPALRKALVREGI